MAAQQEQNRRNEPRQPAEAAPQKGPHLHSAAQLCKALRESGTGADKLKVLREALAANPNLTAEEGYSLLDQATHIVTQRTLDKARGLIDSGEVPPAVSLDNTIPIEETILNDRRANMLRGVGSDNSTLGQSIITAPDRRIGEAELRAQIEAEMRQKYDAELQEKLKAATGAQSVADKAFSEERAAAEKQQAQQNQTTPEQLKATGNDAKNKAEAEIQGKHAAGKPGHK